MTFKISFNIFLNYHFRIKHVHTHTHQEVLEDDNIVKVGIAPIGDANYLAHDYGVCVGNTLDLRFLAIQANCKPSSLAKLSEEYLNVKLDKNWRVRCSDWEVPVLSDAQTEYAAKDAHVAIELFKVFADRLQKRPMWADRKKYLDQILDNYCFSFYDMHFKASHTALSTDLRIKGSTARGAV